MRRFLPGILVVGALTITLDGSVVDADGPPVIPAETLPAVRAVIPASPVNLPLDDAQLLFDQIAAIVDPVTDPFAFTDDSELSGPCGGIVFSYDGGDLVDAVYDAGTDDPPIDLLDGTQAFTGDNLFRIDASGLVTYYGFAPRSGEGPINHEYSIEVAGITVDSGGEPNASGRNQNSGVVDLGAELPFPISAKVDAGATMTSDNLPPCIGSGQGEVVGNGLLDPAGLIGVALLGLGALGTIFNARPVRRWRL